MRNRLFQNVHVVNAMPAANEASYSDLFNGNPATKVVNLSNYERVTWLIQKGSGSTGTAVITCQSCSDTTPSVTTAVPFAYWTCTSGDTWSDMNTATSTGFTTTAGADQVYAVEVNASELSGTDSYVRLVATESINDPVNGTVTCILSGPRYMHEVSQTAIV